MKIIYCFSLFDIAHKEGNLLFLGWCFLIVSPSLTSVKTSQATGPVRWMSSSLYLVAL